MKTLSLDQLIARGRTANVYAWDDDHIIKVFHEWFERKDIEYEMRISRVVHASGVKSPAVGALVQVDGKNGLIYQRVAGESMLNLLIRKPWLLWQYARLFAQLHAEMHKSSFAEDVPELHGKLEYRINHLAQLPAALKTGLVDALHSQPKADSVLHGDFHPANVLVAGSDANIIDWIDASRGSPLADVARTTIILRGVAESKQIGNPLARTFLKLFHAEYLRSYFRLRPGGMDEYQRWLPIVAAARLMEGIKEIEGWLIAEAKKIETRSD
jgi:Ser/Thr protein kinase RdoA (MazF antagonist)